MAIVVGFFLYLLAVCGYAFWRGSAPERVVACACLVAVAATVAATLPRENDFEVVEFEVLIVDASLLAVLFYIALRANRFWPIVATSLQAVTVVVHLAKAANPELVAPVYAFASTGTSLGILLCLWIGTLRHRRRLRKYGNDPSWSSS
jgi:flagellar motor component MotA